MGDHRMIDMRTYAESNAQAARPGEVVLRTRDLVKHYGERTAVNHLNLAVQRGEIFGFLGPNGAGKTTTIRMALGLVTPTDGSVEILGQNVAEQRGKVLPRVGALIETPALHLYMSGRDNLRAVASILGGVPERRIDTVLSLVGLAARQKDRVRTYSLGMKQRLGVAVALLNDPEVLILDEPANGLDPAGIVEMRDLLRQLAAEGKTVFISSHVLGEVQQICTRVAIINLGKLVTEATVEALTQGHGEFVVRVENPPAALAALQRQPWGAGAKLAEDGTIHTDAPNHQGRHISKALLEAGIYPDQITYQTESLEEVFLRLTATGNTGVQ
jgi:ABC-2 type transport system ATP-binding protein